MIQQSDLCGFTGTENWHPHWLRRLLYTDGIKYLADNAGAHWFTDIIATEGIEIHRREPFVAIDLIVKGSKANILFSDSNGRKLKTKRIKFTDFPEGIWKFYLANNVLMLPSEY